MRLPLARWRITANGGLNPLTRGKVLRRKWGRQWYRPGPNGLNPLTRGKVLRPLSHPQTMVPADRGLNPLTRGKVLRLRGTVLRQPEVIEIELELE